MAHALDIDDLDAYLEVPGAIERIRREIADLALAGRLAHADADPTSGPVLLQEIMARTVGAKHQKKLPTSVPDLPDTVPSSWAPTRLGLLASSIVYGTSQKTGSFGEVPVLRMGNIQSNRLTFSDLKFLGEEEVAPKLLLSPGDLLFNRTNSRELVGKSAVFQEFDRPTTFASYLIRVRLDAGVDPNFINLWLVSPYGREWARQVRTDAIGQSNINGTNLSAFCLALPSRDEQERISEAYDAAMAHVDRVGLAMRAEEESRQTLSVVGFRSLATTQDPDAVELLDTLLKTNDDLERVRNTVFELAVQGKLSSSLASDTPVAGFLTAVSQLSLDPVATLTAKTNPEDDLKDLPPGWQWIALGAVITNIQAGWSPSAQAQPAEGDEWGVLKVSACSWGEFRPDENKALQIGQEPRTELEVQSGDFLISRANTSQLVARSVVVDETPPRLMLSDKTLRMAPVNGVNVRYLNLANLSQGARAHYEREASGTSSSMQNVSQKVIRRTPIPLPPPEEQERIMDVVDELMALIGRLRVQLAA